MLCLAVIKKIPAQTYKFATAIPQSYIFAKRRSATTIPESKVVCRPLPILFLVLGNG